MISGYKADLEASCGVERRGTAEPARGAAEIGIPGLVDEPRRCSPGFGLPQMVKPISCLRI